MRPASRRRAASSGRAPPRRRPRAPPQCSRHCDCCFSSGCDRSSRSASGDTKRRGSARTRRADYHPPVEAHRLTTLPGGERVITEHIDGVRSASIGLWIGAGSRDETVAKAGVSHFIEHLLFKGTERYDAMKIAELFDAMGGELNAATSRETTVVYTRVPDDHVDVALDVMTDMVFAPALDRHRLRARGRARGDRDGRRQPAGCRPRPCSRGRVRIASARPAGDRARRGDLLGLAALAARLPPGAYVGPNVVLAAAGNVEHKRIVAALGSAAKGNGAADAARTSASPPAARRAPRSDSSASSTEQYHVCLAGPGNQPRRPAPLCVGAARRDPRRLGLVAALPGDPREARHGLLRLHLRVAVRRRRPDRDLRRHARGEPRASAST